MDLDVQGVKKYLKDNNITYQDLSNMSGIALNTLKNIFSGRTANPRIDTWNTILQSLGLHEVPTFDRELSDGEKEILSLISQLSDDEVDELSSFIDYIVSKRK